MRHIEDVFVKSTLAFPVRLLAAAAFGLFAVSAHAQEVTITHAKGETVLKAKPEKLLVLDIPSLDTLDALGVEPTGVLSSNLPTYLKKYADDKYAKIGTLFEPDYEAINAAEGDLAIIGGRSSKTYPEVSAIVPTIDMTINPKEFIASVKSNVTKLGEITGKQAEAAKLDASIDEKIAALKAVAPDAGKAMILITNAGKVGSYGPSSRLGWLRHRVLRIHPRSQSGVDLRGRPRCRCRPSGGRQLRSPGSRQ
jgi:iron complex transport system substrate-binding protein